MSQTYLLETGSGNYLWEDGNTAIQDIPTKINNATIQLTEASNQKKTILRTIINTIQLTEAKNFFEGLTKTATQYLVSIESALNKKVTFDVFTLEDNSGSYLLESGSGLYRQDIPVKTISSIVGLVDASNYMRTFPKTVNEVVGFTEAVNKVEGFVRQITQKIVNLEEAITKKVSDLNYYTLENGLGSYILESGAGYYAIDNLMIVKTIQGGIVGISDALRNQIDGTVQKINETLLLTETSERWRHIVRSLLETNLVQEASNRARVMYRNIHTVVELLNPTERVNRARIMYRNKNESVIIQEVSERWRQIVRNFSQIVRLSEVSQIIEGIVKIVALETIGLTTLANRIRVVFISHHIGIFTSTSATDIGVFTYTSSENLGEFTVIDSYNFGDFIIIDDN